MSGIELLKRFKTADSNRPVIMVSAKSTSQDLVQGLDVGADDYVAKPFQLTVLLARIRARLRREEPTELTTVQIDGLTIDLQHQVLRRGALETHLTTHENAVLQYLIQRPGQDVSRQELLEQVWGYAPTMQTRTVDNQILKLRKKMELNPARPRYIITVHGVGYRFVQIRLPKRIATILVLLVRFWMFLSSNERTGSTWIVTHGHLLGSNQNTIDTTIRTASRLPLLGA